MLLAVRDGRSIVTVDVAESTQLIRAAPEVGLVLPGEASAAGLALSAHLAPDEVADILGIPLSDAVRADIEDTRARGWSLNAGAVHASANTIGAAVVDGTGRPIAAIVVCAPSDRLTPSKFAAVGELVVEAASSASSTPTSPLVRQSSTSRSMDPPASRTLS